MALQGVQNNPYVQQNKNPMFGDAYYDNPPAYSETDPLGNQMDNSLASSPMDDTYMPSEGQQEPKTGWGKVVGWTLATATVAAAVIGYTRGRNVTAGNKGVKLFQNGFNKSLRQTWAGLTTSGSKIKEMEVGVGNKGSKVYWQAPKDGKLQKTEVFDSNKAKDGVLELKNLGASEAPTTLTKKWIQGNQGAIKGNPERLKIDGVESKFAAEKPAEVPAEATAAAKSSSKATVDSSYAERVQAKEARVARAETKQVNAKNQRESLEQQLKGHEERLDNKQKELNSISDKASDAYKAKQAELKEAQTAHADAKKEIEPEIAKAKDAEAKYKRKIESRKQELKHANEVNAQAEKTARAKQKHSDTKAEYERAKDAEKAKQDNVEQLNKERAEIEEREAGHDKAGKDLPVENKNESQHIKDAREKVKADKLKTREELEAKQAEIEKATEEHQLAQRTTKLAKSKLDNTIKKYTEAKNGLDQLESIELV